MYHCTIRTGQHSPAPCIIVPLGLTQLAVMTAPAVGPCLGMRAVLVGKARWKPQKPTLHGGQGAPALNVQQQPDPGETEDHSMTTRLPQAWLSSGSISISLHLHVRCGLMAVAPHGAQVRGSCPPIWSTPTGPDVVTCTCSLDGTLSPALSRPCTSPMRN